MIIVESKERDITQADKILRKRVETLEIRLFLEFERVSQKTGS